MVSPVVGKLAGCGVVVGDGSLVAGPERVCGSPVLKGNAVVRLVGISGAVDVADPANAMRSSDSSGRVPSCLPVRASVIKAPAVSMTRYGPVRSMLPATQAPGAGRSGGGRRAGLQVSCSASVSGAPRTCQWCWRRITARSRPDRRRPVWPSVSSGQPSSRSSSPAAQHGRRVPSWAPLYRRPFIVRPSRGRSARVAAGWPHLSGGHITPICVARSRARSTAPAG
jgi:hypothetical protein